jgi:hypothetical protein
MAPPTNGPKVTDNVKAIVTSAVYIGNFNGWINSKKTIITKE